MRPGATQFTVMPAAGHLGGQGLRPADHGQAQRIRYAEVVNRLYHPGGDHRDDPAEAAGTHARQR